MKNENTDISFVNGWLRCGFLLALGCFAATAAFAEFKIDRSVMSKEYWAIWNDQAQAKIDADIEKYRKADASFEIAAPDGAEVTVEQKTHSFFFGAHIFNFNQLGKKEWNDRYKDLYGTLFNSATVAFYWRTLEMYPYAPRFEERYEDTEGRSPRMEFLVSLRIFTPAHRMRSATRIPRISGTIARTRKISRIGDVLP